MKVKSIELISATTAFRKKTPLTKKITSSMFDLAVDSKAQLAKINISKKEYVIVPFSNIAAITVATETSGE